MSPACAQSRLDEVIVQLKDLLDTEHRALRRLDHEQIESLTARKVELLQSLGSVSREGASSQTLEALRKVREQALNNQVLLVHARELVRGLLDTWSPAGADARRMNLPRLLEVRG